MSAEEVVINLIDNARAIVDNTTEVATGLAEDAQTAALSVVSLDTIQQPEQPSVTIPPFVPEGDTVAEYKANFDEIFGRLGPEFDSRFDTFMTRFFPKVDECLPETIDDWICNTIQNGGTGVPINIEAQIWERSRAREAADTERQSDELLRGFANRGFMLPQGPLLAAVQDAQEQLSNKVSTHGRDVAIKQIEIEIENIRFAVEQGIRLRLGAISAAMEFIGNWIRLVNSSVDYGTALSQARLQLYQAANAYYNALVNAESLVYQWGRDHAQNQVLAQKNFVELVASNTDARVKAALSAAQSVASIGAAAAAAMNTLADIGNRTVIEG